MSKSLKPVARAPLLSQSVQDAIRSYILENNLKAGAPLPPETVLSKELAVSRNSVREAVKALESVGILETRRGSGLFVRDFSLEPLLENLPYGLLSDLHDLADLLEIRLVLETGLIERAVQTMPDAQLSQLQKIVETMCTRAKREEPFVEEDRQFHQLLFNHLGNRTLLRLLDTFWLTFSLASKHADIRDPHPMRTYKDHADILSAVATKDVGKACEALVQHYAGISERLKREREKVKN